MVYVVRFLGYSRMAKGCTEIQEHTVRVMSNTWPGQGRLEDAIYDAGFMRASHIGGGIRSVTAEGV